MSRSRYSYGCDILGAAPVYGPESPEDLANADRVLTPAEQTFLSNYQSQMADEMLKAERAKGGPQSATVAVTSKGAIIERPRTTKDDDQGMPPWQIAALATGGAAVLVGVIMLLSSPGGGRRLGYAR